MTQTKSSWVWVTIENMPFGGGYFSRHEIWRVFAPFGSIEAITISPSTCTCNAFVCYTSEASVILAVQHLDNAPLPGLSHLIQQKIPHVRRIAEKKQPSMVMLLRVRPGKGGFPLNVQNYGSRIHQDEPLNTPAPPVLHGLAPAAFKSADNPSINKLSQLQALQQMAQSCQLDINDPSVQQSLLQLVQQNVNLLHSPQQLLRQLPTHVQSLAQASLPPAEVGKEDEFSEESAEDNSPPHMSREDMRQTVRARFSPNNPPAYYARFDFGPGIFQGEPEFSVVDSIVGENQCNIEHILRECQNSVTIEFDGTPSSTCSDFERLTLSCSSEDEKVFHIGVSLVETL